MVIHDVIVYYHHNPFFIPSQGIISPLFSPSVRYDPGENRIKQNKTMYMLFHSSGKPLNWDIITHVLELFL